MKQPGCALLLCIIGCVGIGTGCGGTGSNVTAPPTPIPNPPEQKKNEPPEVSAQTTDTRDTETSETDVPSTTPTAQPKPVPTQFNLLEALMDSEDGPSGKFAMRIRGKKQQYATWHFQPDGTVDGTPWMAYQAWWDDLSGYTGSSSSAPREKKHLTFALRPNDALIKIQYDIEEAAIETREHVRIVYTLVASVSGALEGPDQRNVQGVYRVYAYGGWTGWDLITFTPRNLKKNDWSIVISKNALSPMGPIRGVSRGDFDGDGQPDIAFVVEGIGDCDHPVCPLAWVVLLLSDEPLHKNQFDSLLFSNDDVDALSGRCPHLKYDSYPFEKFTWKTKLRRGSLDVAYAYENCELRWQFQKTGDGKFDRISPPSRYLDRSFFKK